MITVKKHIPNLITLLNLFSGCVALVYAAKSNYEFAFYFVCLGIFLDFFDGFFARLFKVSSPLGLQLDSLADMVTSGVVPGYIMYAMLSTAQHDLTDNSFFAYLGFIVTMGSCYRLAKFNIDTRQTDSFIGLPTPANTLFILSLPLVLQNSDSLLVLEVFTSQWFLLTVILGSAYILNAEILLFSLKFKNFTFRDNLLQIVFLLFSFLLLLFFHFGGMSLIILFYVLLSVINNRWIKKSAL